MAADGLQREQERRAPRAQPMPSFCGKPEHLNWRASAAGSQWPLLCWLCKAHSTLRAGLQFALAPACSSIDRWVCSTSCSTVWIDRRAIKSRYSLPSASTPQPADRALLETPTRGWIAEISAQVPGSPARAAGRTQEIRRRRHRRRQRRSPSFGDGGSGRWQWSLLRGLGPPRRRHATPISSTPCVQAADWWTKAIMAQAMVPLAAGLSVLLVQQLRASAQRRRELEQALAEVRGAGWRGCLGCVPAGAHLHQGAVVPLTPTCPSPT